MKVFDCRGLEEAEAHFLDSPYLSSSTMGPKAGTGQRAALFGVLPFRVSPPTQKRKRRFCRETDRTRAGTNEKRGHRRGERGCAGDVSGMAFDRTLPREERLARFVKRAVNPYCFSVGGVGVKIEFAEGGPSLQDALAAFLIRQKSGL